MNERMSERMNERDNMITYGELKKGSALRLHLSAEELKRV